MWFFHKPLSVLFKNEKENHLTDTNHLNIIKVFGIARWKKRHLKEKKENKKSKILEKLNNNNNKRLYFEFFSYVKVHILFKTIVWENVIYTITFAVTQ